MAEEATETTETTETAEATGEVEAPPKPAKSYSKAELDAIVAKEGVKIRREFGDILELREKADQFDKLQESSKTNEDKLRERADKAVRERDQAMTRATGTMIRAAIIAAASRLGSVDPEAVAALVNRDDLIVEGDEVIGAEEAVKALLSQKAYLRASGANRGGSELGGSTVESPIITRSQIKNWARSGELTPERVQQIEEANKAGRIRANA